MVTVKTVVEARVNKQLLHNFFPTMYYSDRAEKAVGVGGKSEKTVV